jgi:hypothetical protein
VKRPRAVKHAPAVKRIPWRAYVAVTFNGTATVEAATEEEARELIKSGDFEFNAATAVRVDWSDPTNIERDE